MNYGSFINFTFINSQRTAPGWETLTKSNELLYLLVLIIVYINKKKICALKHLNFSGTF